MYIQLKFKLFSILQYYKNALLQEPAPSCQRAMIALGKFFASRRLIYFYPESFAVFPSHP